MELLHEQDDIAIVKISQRFELTNNSLEMFIANFSIDEIELLHTDLHYSSANFRMSPAQMDDLCAAWEAYKLDQTAKAIAERNRLVAIEAEAYRLAASYPEIKVTPHTCTNGQPAWEVTIPSVGWNCCKQDWQYCQDDFFAEVKAAIEYYTPIAEAFKLAETCPALNISHDGEGHALWHIALPESDFDAWADQGKIMQIVMDAIVAYEKHVKQPQQ